MRHVTEDVLLQPIYPSLEEWFAALDEFRDIPFMEDGREQPPMPEHDIDLDPEG